MILPPAPAPGRSARRRERAMRELRLIPLVLLAAASLFTLKAFGLMTAGGYTLGSPRQAHAEGNDASTLAPGLSDLLGPFAITGSVAGRESSPKAQAKEDKKRPETGRAAGAAPASDGIAVPVDGRPVSPAERAILESLQQRRHELDQRARELDVRENLIAAAEKQLEARQAELREIEARINTTLQKKDEAEAARFKSLVAMYENMKPKDAAKIFDRLELKVLTEVVAQMNPRRMSDILAQMSPEAAERLTVEIATRAHLAEKAPATSDLPKIEGRPGG
jgi:flagellar motility protein MotE (MotC chaperone)